MLKAGSAGSNPDGATTSKSKTSYPFSVLLMDIGEAIASLNTVVVGLDAVEKGHPKPEGIDISWNPDDRKAAARKSRKFVLEAVLIRVAEALIEFTKAMSRVDRLESVQRDWNSNTPNADKVNDILSVFVDKEDEQEGALICAAVLLIHWRNRIVHRTSNAHLRSEQKRLLQSQETAIAQRYSGLSIDCLLCHFAERRPTLKDVSSLTAICINLCRLVDENIHSDLSKDELDKWLDYYGLAPLIDRIRAETSPTKLQASIQRLFLSAAGASQLWEAYRKHYLSDAAADQSK